MLQKIDKALTLLKTVRILKDILNKNTDFTQSIQGLEYLYHIVVKDELEDEISKFTIGLKSGKMEFTPTFKPDIIVTLTEEAFYGIIYGNTTLEQAYYADDAEIWASDGNWSVHLPGIKMVFDSIEDAVRTELKGKL